MKIAKHLIISATTSTITDNIIRTLSMVMALSVSVQGGLYATIAFVLPYLVFSPFAGELGDRFSKTRLIVFLKALEIFLIALLIVAMHTGSSILMLTATLLSGIQSSFISPSRLGLIPELADGNILRLSSWMDGSTFMGVLVGTGIALIRPISDNAGIPHSMTIITTTCIVMYIIGLWSSIRLTQLHPSGPCSREKISFSWLKTFRTMSQHVSAYSRWTEIWAIGAFWGIASIMIAEAEPIAVSIGLHASSVRYIVPIMSIGIGCGSFFTAITGFRNIFWSSICMIGLCGLICVPVHHLHLAIFWPFAICVFTMCFFGGILSSVLYAELMKNTQGHTSSILATNNICNSLIMLLASVILIPMGSTNPRVLLFACALICFPVFLKTSLKKG